MQADETALPPELPVTAAPPRAIRLDAVHAPTPPEKSGAAEIVAAATGPGTCSQNDPAPAKEASEVAAPRRAVRLVAKKPLTEEERQAERRTRQERVRAEAEAARRPRLEKKLASLHDASDMLRVMDTELALRRAQRLQGEGAESRQTLRVLAIAALFALLIAALGAMFWMQDRLARTGFSRHRVEAAGPR